MTDDRLTQLYRTYGPVIYARCLKLLRDEAAAEDATQETFMRVHRHLAKAPDSQEALAWIYRIATNYCLNQIRDRKLHATPTDALPDRPGASLEDLLADRDYVACLIGHLPEQHRAVVWLHHVDGIDQGEVGRILGISRRTVVNRLAEFTVRAQQFVRRASA